MIKRFVGFSLRMLVVLVLWTVLSWVVTFLVNCTITDGLIALQASMAPGTVPFAPAYLNGLPPMFALALVIAALWATINILTMKFQKAPAASSTDEG